MYITYTCGVDGLGENDGTVDEEASRWGLYVVDFLERRFPHHKVSVDVDECHSTSRVRTDDPEIDPEELAATISNDVWADYCSEDT